MKFCKPVMSHCFYLSYKYDVFHHISKQFFIYKKLYIITNVKHERKKGRVIMSGEVTESRERVQVNIYAQANGGIIKNPIDEKFSNIGAALGGEVSYKGTYLRGEAGVGTALSGKLEAGHEFDLGKNFGLDLSAKAQAAKSLKANSLTTTFDTRTSGTIAVENGATGEYENVPFSLGRFQQESSTWKPGENRVGVQAELTYQNDIVKLGLGVEGGMRKSTSPDIDHQFTNNESIEFSINGGKPEKVELNAAYSYQKNQNIRTGYITPTVSAEVKFGKNSNFSFVANGDMYQGQAGIRYTF